ncbi:MAG: hypothetical protein IJ692_03740 [Alloprevotella sp.]|nr:hypothetical protein [Alloprevotella sp.]MBR1645131.1 hypothetical protein [Bacteroidales bacterium]MBR1652485.1 hypothetical protein [Alloprevotella sp.]
MKKINVMLLSLCGLLTLSSCMDSHDDPNTENFSLTSPVSVGEVNTTIGEVKARFCASSDGADFIRTSSNYYTKVKEDLVIEGVVCANDISGNLYQTLLIRNVKDTAPMADGVYTIDEYNPDNDQCIQLKIKNTCLYPYFALGQRIKINLKGIYAGVYSKTPSIGQPYYTSYGNNNLGPMLLELCKTHIELVGKPNPNAPELMPIDMTDEAGDTWLRATANRTSENCPQLAKVRGLIEEMLPENRYDAATGEVTGKKEPLYEVIDGRAVEAKGELEGKTLWKIWAPEVLHDDGYGVDRTIRLQTNTSKVTLRTSTENDIAFSLIPDNVRTYTGLLTYYDRWQVQLRTLDDISAE